jgi:hypothetical protein
MWLTPEMTRCTEAPERSLFRRAVALSPPANCSTACSSHQQFCSVEAGSDSHVIVALLATSALGWLS